MSEFNYDASMSTISFICNSEAFEGAMSNTIRGKSRETVLYDIVIHPENNLKGLRG